MGYIIRYGDDVPDWVPARPFRGYWIVLVLLCVLMGVWLREWVVFVDLEDFRQAVAGGEPFGEALESFCRDVLVDADILS